MRTQFSVSAFLFASMAFGQTATVAQVTAPPSTVPVYVTVNWPPMKLVEVKYGPLPKWAVFGEVIGCNYGDANLTYGEGDIIATLRNQGGLQAFSRQDALLLTGNSQNASKKNVWTGWIKAGAQSAIEAKASGLFGSGTATGAGIVIGAQLINIFLPNISGVLSLRQVIQYNTDGLQTVMALPAGRCTVPFSVLFAAPGKPPVQSETKPQKFKVDVPRDR